MELICRAYWCKHNDIENEKCLLDRIVIDEGGIASYDLPLCISYEDEDADEGKIREAYNKGYQDGVKSMLSERPTNMESPNNCKYLKESSGDVWECGCFLEIYCEHQIYDRYPDGTLNIVRCNYEPHDKDINVRSKEDEPQTDELQFVKRCHKPQSSHYRCYCDEREEEEYCNGCKFWHL